MTGDGLRLRDPRRRTGGRGGAASARAWLVRRPRSLAARARSCFARQVAVQPRAARAGRVAARRRRRGGRRASRAARSFCARSSHAPAIAHLCPPDDRRTLRVVFGSMLVEARPRGVERARPARARRHRAARRCVPRDASSCIRRPSWRCSPKASSRGSAPPPAIVAAGAVIFAAAKALKWWAIAVARPASGRSASSSCRACRWSHRDRIAGCGTRTTSGVVGELVGVAAMLPAPRWPGPWRSSRFRDC